MKVGSLARNGCEKGLKNHGRKSDRWCVIVSCPASRYYSTCVRGGTSYCLVIVIKILTAAVNFLNDDFNRTMTYSCLSSLLESPQTCPGILNQRLEKKLRHSKAEI